MRNIYKTIASLAALYTLVGGCATSGMSAQERKNAELDALLSTQVISEQVKPESVEPAVVEAPKPEQAPKERSLEMDLSQYLVNPENEEDQQSDQVERNILESKKIMEDKYNDCITRLTNRLPSGATGECNGTTGSEYLICNFNIEGQDYKISVPFEEVNEGGFEVAYKQLIKESPQLLEVMAERYCRSEEIEMNVEVDEVLSLR